MLLTFILSLLLFSICLNCSPPTSPIIEQISLYAARDEYCAWPSIIRAKNGDLLISFCRSEEHLGPNGDILMLRSRDNGETWSKPEIFYQTPLDDRECGLTLLSDGLILTHLWSTFHTRERYTTTYAGSYEQQVLDRWSDLVDQPTYQTAAHLAGARSTISRDNGKTWSEPLPGTDSIHGGIELADGTLLVASYRKSSPVIGVLTAAKPEGPWQQIAALQSPTPETLRFGEPHVLQLASGRTLMMIRATAIPYDDAGANCFLWESYSDDNGHTWVEPFQTPLWGFPPHLLLLEDGRIVCVYGYRRPPYGQRACVSADGITWKKENEIILRDDAHNHDLGYPASVELDPGVVLTIYYQPDPADGPQRMNPPDPTRSKPDILGTIWRVPPAQP